MDCVTEQQAADLRALLAASKSAEYPAFSKLTIESEIIWILRNHPNPVYEAARRWFFACSDAYDNGETEPMLPFEAQGLSVQGQLSTEISSTHKSLTKDGPPSGFTAGEDGLEMTAVRNTRAQGAARNSSRKSSKETWWTPAGYNPTLKLSKHGLHEGVYRVLPAPEETTTLHAEEDYLKRDREGHVSVGVGEGPKSTAGKYTTNLIGLVASANLSYEMGLRSQCGFWYVDSESQQERPFEMIWMKIPVHRICIEKLHWWRGGSNPVISVWSHRGAYVLQSPALTFYPRFVACPLHQEKTILPFDWNAERPKWAKAPWYKDLRTDWERLSTTFPSMLTAPAPPAVSITISNRLKVEGELACKEWRFRLIQDEVTLVKDSVDSTKATTRITRKKREDALNRANDMVAAAKNIQNEIKALRARLEEMDNPSSVSTVGPHSENEETSDEEMPLAGPSEVEDRKTATHTSATEPVALLSHGNAPSATVQVEQADSVDGIAGSAGGHPTISVAQASESHVAARPISPAPPPAVQPALVTTQTSPPPVVPITNPAGHQVTPESPPLAPVALDSPAKPTNSVEEMASTDVPTKCSSGPNRAEVGLGMINPELHAVAPGARDAPAELPHRETLGGAESSTALPPQNDESAFGLNAFGQF
ncbi:hypothetical protein FRC09_020196 [Ceratobasidium sp. 395]|nr:hypothetical protein FRC09_020196 [Ceratobasidium sp. 395]